jgi:hypothetical protein
MAGHIRMSSESFSPPAAPRRGHRVTPTPVKFRIRGIRRRTHEIRKKVESGK